MDATFVRLECDENATERRVDEITEESVDQRDEREREQEEAERRGRRRADKAEIDWYDRHADQPVRRAEFACIVDGLGRDLRHAERDQREIHSAHPVDDDATDQAGRNRERQDDCQRAAEGNACLECKCRGIGAEAEIERLAE
jgi:hypothetical protein